MLKAAIVPVTPFAQNCSLLWCDETQRGAVVDPGGDLDRVLAAAAKHNVKAKAILREMLSGPAAYPIVREAKKVGADLIVLGTHGRRGVRRLVLGSDAEQVVRTASVPVLLIRA